MCLDFLHWQCVFVACVFLCNVLSCLWFVCVHFVFSLVSGLKILLVEGRKIKKNKRAKKIKVEKSKPDDCYCKEHTDSMSSSCDVGFTGIWRGLPATNHIDTLLTKQCVSFSYQKCSAQYFILKIYSTSQFLLHFSFDFSWFWRIFIQSTPPAKYSTANVW